MDSNLPSLKVNPALWRSNRGFHLWFLWVLLPVYRLKMWATDYTVYPSCEHCQSATRAFPGWFPMSFYLSVLKTSHSLTYWQEQGGSTQKEARGKKANPEGEMKTRHRSQGKNPIRKDRWRTSWENTAGRESRCKETQWKKAKSNSWWYQVRSLLVKFWSLFHILSLQGPYSGQPALKVWFEKSSPGLVTLWSYNSVCWLNRSILCIGFIMRHVLHRDLAFLVLRSSDNSQMH